MSGTDWVANEDFKMIKKNPFRQNVKVKCEAKWREKTMKELVFIIILRLCSLDFIKMFIVWFYK